MNLIDIMKENGIDNNWLFSLAKLGNNEGLIFFEPISEIDDKTQEEIQSLDPKCIIIDGAKFIYHEEMDKEITIKSTNNMVVLTRIDGFEIKLASTDFVSCPFRLEEFKNTKPIVATLNAGFVALEN